MGADVNGLARFRASPEKVRVAIRRNGHLWLATVQSRVCGTSSAVHYGRHRYAYRAVVLALIEAERADLDGIDLGMGWVYDHPMATKEQRNHYERSGATFPPTDESGGG